MFGTNSTNRPPNGCPGSNRPRRPPARRAAIRQAEREAVGRDELHRDRAERAGDAGIERADAEGQRLVERGVDAHRRAAIGLSRIAMMRAAAAAAHQIGGAEIHHQRTARVKIVEPLVGVDRQAERRVGLDRSRCPARRRSSARAGEISGSAASRSPARRSPARDRCLAAAAPATRTGSRRQSTRRRPPAASSNRHAPTCPSGSPRYRRRCRKTRCARARTGR